MNADQDDNRFVPVDLEGSPSSWNYYSQQGEDALLAWKRQPSSFLVSDDEEEGNRSYCTFSRGQQQDHRPLVDDDSPVPVPCKTKGADSRYEFPSGVLFPEQGLNDLSTKSSLLFGGNALPPRNDSQRFFMPKSAAFLDTNLNQIPHIKTRQPVATAISEENLSCSSKRVTFVPSPTTSMTTMWTATSPRPTPLTATTSRGRRRSQSIAIRKTRYSSHSLAQPGGIYQDEDHASQNENLYDSATWRMYHRIVDHRRSQQQHRMLVQPQGGSLVEHDNANNFALLASQRQSSRSSGVNGLFRQGLPSNTTASTSTDIYPSSMMLLQPSCPHFMQSSNSSLASRGMDEMDDEIFEMDL